MAKNQDIRGVVAGDDVRVNVTITSISTGLTISKAWLTVKSNPSDADASALVQAAITTSATSTGQITDTGADGTAGMYFILANTSTDDAEEDYGYSYDVQLKMSDGSLYTPLVGRMFFTQSITDATS